MKNLPLVSIIIPVYNATTYFSKCLESVFNQNYNNIEILLVDDGSTDRSGELCNRIAEIDSRIISVHKRNSRQGGARNVGLSIARGKYVWFIDVDDWISPDSIEYLVNEAEEKNLDILYFSAETIVEGDRKNFSTGIVKYNHIHNLNKIMDGLTAFQRMTEKGEYFTHNAMRFYSRQLLQEHGLTYQENIIHEDEDFGFLSAILAKRVEIVDRRIYQRRYHPGSTMTAKTKMRSLQGYAAAFSGLAEMYSAIRPTGVLNDVYVRKMMEYLQIVVWGYLDANKIERVLIRKYTQNLLRNGLKNHVPVDTSMIIAEVSLPFYRAYYYPRKMASKLKRLLQANRREMK